MRKTGIYLISFLVFTACQKDLPLQNAQELNAIVIPEGFPEIEFPEDNVFTPERWQLGKLLFYDNRLSSNNSINCGSCHLIEKAFSDNKAFSHGVENRLGTRNSPTLANVAYHPYFTREGGVKTLESQILVPIQEHNEFDFNIIEISKRLSTDSNYQLMSHKAYGRKLDYYVITRAIANFERSIISGNSRFDQWRYQNKKHVLKDIEFKGMQLFYSSKTHCSECHSGFDFTNYKFANNGLYNTYSDIGRKRLTQHDSDLSVFKIPTLRNIEFTAPYMHDGSIKTLQEVVDHYNAGGKSHPNKSAKIKPLNLSDDEKQQLLSFLKTLSDESFIHNQTLKP
ncbi:MAG: cytochrome c peroxidase [Bacteroidota bacterium]|nr:cytochrome c peroxidase [Bacteroidota bacterium]